MIPYLNLNAKMNFGLMSVSIVLALSACSTSTNNAIQSSSPQFSLPGIDYSWFNKNSKYLELSKGPLAGEIGAALTGPAMKQALEAEYNALENRNSGEITKWQYSKLQNGKITSYPPYQVGSSSCRRYIHSVSVNGNTSQAAGTACRNKDGIWTPLT